MADKREYHDDFVPVPGSAGPPAWDRRESGGSRPALLVLGVGVTVVVLLIVGIVALLVRSGSSMTQSASDLIPTQSVAESSPSSARQSVPAETSEPEPNVAGIDGGPGPVAGNNFSVADNPYKIGPTRMPFAFAFPDGWDCMFSTTSTVQTTGGYTCMESSLDTSGGTIVTKESHAGGRVGFQHCGAVCTPADIDEVGKQMRILPDDWRDIEASTTFAERTGEIGDETQTRVGMRHVYAPGGAGEPTVIAFAVMTGDPEYRDTMLKILNSVRVNAH
ncbi:hypothetical protein AAFP30_16495 [Gordonia sp. CPCC 205515]|uniref:hypothetical protein n=1 Tax=Gordonia sp. CPCC 205515 TaxID=3140791 RepID=UPI003AF36561